MNNRAGFSTMKALVRRNMGNTFLYRALSFLYHRIEGDGKAARADLVLLRNNVLKSSIFIFEQELPMASLFPRAIIDAALRIFNPRSILDLGCGTGQSLDYFVERGIDVVGIEGSALAIRKAKNPTHIRRHNLNRELNLNRIFDMIWSFEFVEHIHPVYARNLLRTFSNHSDNIVMSAAQPNQDGDGHFNEQPEAYWIEQFAAFGFRCDRECTETLRRIDDVFARNMLVFRR